MTTEEQLSIRWWDWLITGALVLWNIGLVLAWILGGFDWGYPYIMVSMCVIFPIVMGMVG